ncbi:MAG TPA: hypothetical protein PLS84_12030, partial [Salinivirgaceae bacterium]|nr:hypothetical protein [Salinivirgaceae bacterium]
MATNGATAATRALGKAMMTNPYAAIAVAAAAAVTAIALLVKYIKTQTSEMLEQSKIIKELKGVRDNYIAGLEVERQTMNDLFEQIKKTNVGTNERKVLVDELNRNYKDYLPNLDLEKATIQELAIAQKASNVELQNKIAIQAQDKAMSEIITQMTDLKIKEMEVTKELEMAEWQRIEAMKTGADVPLFYAAEDELDAIRDSLQAYEQQLKNVQEYFRGQITATQQSTTEIKANTTATQTNTSATNTAIDAYKSYLETIAKINEDARLSIELGESRIEVRKRELEAIYSATKAYFELDGYTADEIKKLKELRAEIDKLNDEIEKENKAREEENKKIEEAKKRYQDYLGAIKKANEEAKLQIALGED